MSVHAFLCASFWLFCHLLLLSRCPFAGISHGTVLLTCQWSSLGCSVVKSSVFIAENRRFVVQPSLPSLNQDTDNLSANNKRNLVDNRPLSSFVTGNDCNILFNTSNCFAYSSPERRLSVAHKRNVKRHKRPCAYYANTSATFHLPLFGDLTFKLHPGPEQNRIIQLYLVPVAPLESEPHCLLAVTFS